MQKWEYAHAIYKDKIGRESLGPFLYRAGQSGWELCGVLPYPSINKPDGALAAVFKRPA